MIVYNAGGDNVSYRKGSEGAMPDIPTMNSDDIPLAVVKRAANDNSVSDAEIYDFKMFIEETLVNPTRSEPARALDTNYQNTTGRPVMVVSSIEVETGNTGSGIYKYGKLDLLIGSSSPPTTNINTVTQGAQVYSAGADYVLGTMTLVGIVPDNYYYKILETSDLGSGGAVTLKEWHEYQL